MEIIRVVPYELWGILIFIYGSYRLYILIRYTEKYRYLEEISAIFLSYSGALITLLAHYGIMPEFPTSLFFTLIIISFIIAVIGKIIAYKNGSFKEKVEIKDRLFEASVMLIMLLIFLLVIYIVKYIIKG